MRNKLVGGLVALAMLMAMVPTGPQRVAQAQSNGCFFVVRSFDAGLYYVGEYLTFKPADAPQGYVVGAGGVCPVNAATPTPAPGQTNAPTATPTTAPSGSSTASPTPTSTASSGSGSLTLTGLSNLYYCGTPSNPILSGADLTYCPAAFVQLGAGQATFSTSGFSTIPLVYPSADRDYGNYLQIISQAAHSFTVAAFAFNAVGNPPPINTADASVAKLIIFGTGSVANPNPTPALPTTAPTATPAPTAAPTTTPTAAPTAAPTSAPTSVPTSTPTAVPTATPTPVPTNGPVTVSQSTLGLTSGDIQALQIAQSGNSTQNFTFTTTNAGAASYTYSNGTLTITAGNPGSATITVHSGVDSQTAPIAITVSAGSISVTPLPLVVVAGGPTANATINQPDGGTLNTYTTSGYVSANLSIVISNRTSMAISAPVGAAIGVQHATITSSDGGTTLVSITVQAAPPLTVSPTSLPLIANTTQQLSAFQTGTSIFSASSDTPGVATVAAATFGTTVGIIAGSAAGSGNIIIGGADGLTKTVPFTVSTPAPSSISLSPNTVSLVVGASTGNTSQIAQTGTGLTYTVASGGGYDSTIAQVTISGATATVTALKAGSTVASIVSSDGVNTAPLTINVNNGPITANPSGTIIVTLPTTQSLALSQAYGTGNTYTPDSVCASNYTISPSTASAGPFTITPVAVGSCTTTFTTSYGRSISISVMVQYGNVTVNGGSAANATVGAGNVTVPITQAGTTSGVYSVSGLSSSIATAVVSGQTLVITPVGAGTTTATVTSTTSGRSGTLTINVAATPAVVASPTSLAFYTGGVAQSVVFSQPTNTTPTYTVTATPNPALFSFVRTGASFALTPQGSVAGSTSLAVQGIDGATKSVPLTLATPIPITAAPNPVNIANAGTALVNALQGSNTSLNTSSSNTAVFTVGAAFTNTGAINLTGTTAGGSANLIISSNVSGGGNISVPVNVATPTPTPAPTTAPTAAPTATPTPTPTTAPIGATSDAQITTALTNAGVTRAWPLNDAAPNTTLAASIGGTAITIPSGTTGFSAVSPIVNGSTHSEFLNSVSAALTTPITTLPSGSTWSVGIVLLPSSLTGTTGYSVFTQSGTSAGSAPQTSPHTGVDLYVDNVGRVHGGFGTVNGATLSYAAIGSNAAITTSSGPSTTATLGHLAVLSWDGAGTATLTLDGVAKTLLVNTGGATFAPSTQPLTLGYERGGVGMLGFIGYAQYLFYSPTVLTSTQNTTLYNTMLGPVSGATPAPSPTPAAVSLQTSSSCSGSPVTSIALTYPTAQTFTVCQTGYTTGFSVGTPAPTGGVTAAIASGNQLTLTPGTNATASTNITINGNGSVGLILNIGTRTTAYKPRKLPNELAWYFKGVKG